jgi:hypothetical protein
MSGALLKTFSYTIQKVPQSHMNTGLNQMLNPAVIPKVLKKGGARKHCIEKFGH